ncbi:acyl-CoA dehydrogenase family protein [Streptomyces pacificus]|uniref:Acyl-CoA/acyl-ACP dehydrogenase n=1 Tax=Streptomyces pacificus TaxID=2705029 RepID=A0A6A0B0Q6_9ACTN|nr:acyl-CoA dehydrogenase family protein [Streptomyces pacificus]GFH38191.1 acyl-CoA/acyl-ACP dehydrogenase [Streptomyces pacificus]
MDAAFTAEQSDIRRTLRGMLSKGVPAGPPGRGGDSTADAGPGYDPALWARLAGGPGLPGLALDEEYGGAGCGTLELALAFEEIGRALVPLPLLATSGLAAPLIAALGTVRQRLALLPRIADGSLTATLCVPGAALATALALTRGDPDGTWAGGGRAGGVQARSDGTGRWRLHGEATQVLDGHSAGLLLVAARTGGFTRGRTLLFLVRCRQARGADAGGRGARGGDAGGREVPGVCRTRWTVLDDTRPQGRVQLRGTPAELLGDDPGADVPTVLAATGRTVAALLAAEAAGTASAALDRTLAQVGEREQFGRPIGSFQAVKHRLADLYVQVQAARSAAYYAAWDPREGGLALAQCLQALRAVAGEAIQLHGGIGFTWEHDAHLYFKRAASDELLFGPVHRLRAHAAEAAGLFAPAASAAPLAPLAPVGLAPVGLAAPGASAVPGASGGPAVPAGGTRSGHGAGAVPVPGSREAEGA